MANNPQSQPEGASNTHEVRSTSGANPAAPETAQAKPNPADAKAKEAVHKNFDDAKDKAVDELDQVLTEHFTISENALDPKAKNAYEALVSRQKNELAALFDQKKQEYESKSAENTMQSSINRDQLAQQLFKEARDNAALFIKLRKSILAKIIKDKNITTSEVFQIQEAILGLQRMAKEHPELQEIVNKLGHSQELKEDDYANVVAILNPLQIKTDKPSLSEAFEATSAGLIVSLMRPDQRFNLVRAYMESPKRNDTPKLLEGFLSTGILTRYQAEELMKHPAAAGINFSAEFKAKLASGQFYEQAEKFRNHVKEETDKNLAGRNTRNIVDQFMGGTGEYRGIGEGIVDSPFVYALATLWGTLTTGLNIWASMDWSWDNPSESMAKSLANIAANPWVAVGGVVTAFGVQGFSGTMEGKGFMGGVVLEALDSLQGSDREAFLKKNAHNVLGSVYLNAPSGFASYIDNGGFETMLALKREKAEKGQPPIITYKDLVGDEAKKIPAFEKDPTRLSLLKSLKDSTFFNESGINKKLNFIAESAFAMSINNNNDFMKEIGKIRSEQTTPLAPSPIPVAAPGTAVAKNDKSSTPTVT